VYIDYGTERREKERAVFLSGQAGLSGGFQMRFPAGLAAFLGGLSLNRIFCSKDSAAFTKKVSKVRNINHIQL
jgi:hypothetical protein